MLEMNKRARGFLNRRDPALAITIGCDFRAQICELIDGPPGRPAQLDHGRVKAEIVDPDYQQWDK